MFSKATFAFLDELAANNERPWFEANKPRYEELVREPALEFIAAMAVPLAKFAPHFRAEPRKMGGSLMRVFRDTRFARDKTPYKTNIGIRRVLDILYRDDCLVAIHKPAGLLVHRSDIDRHETRFAVQLLRDQIGQRVHPLHRLDKGTSGVLLFALDAGSAREVGGQFQRDEVTKRYLAIVRGWPPESGVIDHALSRQFDDYGRKPSPGSKAGALPAVTGYRRLATVELPDAVDRYPTSRYALLS
jgi:23S rRNA-/tRNA-specific pseudouridylate synthase